MKWLLGVGVVALIGWFFFAQNSPQPQNVNTYDEPGVTYDEPGTTYGRTDDPETTRSYGEYGDYDCSDFSSQSEAQDFFESEGGPDEDYHNLDRDGDGYVCESL